MGLIAKGGSVAARGFAGRHRAIKERYYDLKERGISWLAERGHLSAVYRHGGLAVWTGLGYSLHSTPMPRGAALESRGDDATFQEAKPLSAHEMRLAKAIGLIEQLGVTMSKFDRCPAPRIERPARPRTDWREEDEEEDDFDD